MRSEQICLSLQDIVKKYRHEIATDDSSAYRVVGGLLYHVGEVYENYCGDIRKSGH